MTLQECLLIDNCRPKADRQKTTHNGCSDLGKQFALEAARRFRRQHGAERR
jgi:hypothetical protein